MSTRACWGPGCDVDVSGQDVMPRFHSEACRVAWRAQHTIGATTPAAEPESLPPAPATFSTGTLRLVDVEAIERELEQAHAVTRPSPVRRVLNRITRRSA